MFFSFQLLISLLIHIVETMHENNNSKYEYSEEGNCQIQEEIIPLAIVTIKNRITKRKVSDEIP